MLILHYKISLPMKPNQHRQLKGANNA